MVAPFDSSLFFSDPFFTQQRAGSSQTAVVTHNGTTASLSSIYRHGLDPMRDGPLIKLGGHWAEICFLIVDWEAAFGVGSEPAIQDVVTCDGESFRVQAHSKDGDTITIKAIGNQRKGGRL